MFFCFLLNIFVIKCFSEVYFSFLLGGRSASFDGYAYIGLYAFLSYNENSLTNITIGKYVLFGLDSDGPFYNSGKFDAFYHNNMRKAGRYSFVNGNWRYTP
jgi:hypothetical protein